MRIKVFIVTYNNDAILKERALKSLLESINLKDPKHSITFTILNNFGTLKLEPEHEGKFEVINNHGRPDWSTGHLARSWNQALMFGFKNLTNPDADIVVCMQNDAVVKPEWINVICKLHETYDFVHVGRGDEFHSYKPAHVIKVGMWDERFCGIGDQEGDYFVRSVLRNGTHTTINDWAHSRTHNPISQELSNLILDVSVAHGYERREPYYVHSVTMAHEHCRMWFVKKWPGFPITWNGESIRSKMNAATFPLEFKLYPYFENAIDPRIYAV